jgi:hypothetical protein
MLYIGYSWPIQAVAHKDLRGDRKFFPPKRLLQTAAGIVFPERMWIFVSPCVLVTSIQNPSPCEACFTHQQHSAAVAICRLTIRQRLLSVLCLERIQQLITVRCEVWPRARGLFYGTQNTFFHIGDPAISWSTSSCHTGLHTTFQRHECRAIWMPSLLIPFSVQTSSGCTVTVCFSISVNSSNENSAFCSILQCITCLP